MQCMHGKWHVLTMSKSEPVGLMGVAKGGSWGSWDPPNPPVIIFYHGRGGVQYSTVSVYCTQYAFYAHQIWSPQGHGLSLEDPRGQLTTSLVLGFKFLVLAKDCQSLALASDYQSLAFALGSKSLVLALALGYQSLALSLEVVLDIALNIQIFWQPTQHRLAFSQVSRST